MNTARTKCALPIDLADVPLRKANKDDFRCGDFAKDNSLKPVGLFQLEPTEHQVAFEGDSLKLKCRVQVSASQKVRNILYIKHRAFVQYPAVWIDGFIFEYVQNGLPRICIESNW